MQTYESRQIVDMLFSLIAACWSGSETLAGCHRGAVPSSEHTASHARPSSRSFEASPHISIQLDTRSNHTGDFLLAACENMRFHRETRRCDDTFRLIRRKIKNSKNWCATSQWPLLLVLENSVKGAEKNHLLSWRCEVYYQRLVSHRHRSSRKASSAVSLLTNLYFGNVTFRNL